jgi:hypothetical protein
VQADNIKEEAYFAILKLNTFLVVIVQRKLAVDDLDRRIKYEMRRLISRHCVSVVR